MMSLCKNNFPDKFRETILPSEMSISEKKKHPGLIWEAKNGKWGLVTEGGTVKYFASKEQAKEWRSK